MLNNLSYYLSDEYADNSPTWQKIKHALCGDHWFGNLFAPLWINISCTCCAFFRGVVVGGLLGAIVAWLMS